MRAEGVGPKAPPHAFFVGEGAAVNIEHPAVARLGLDGEPQRGAATEDDLS